MPSIHIITDSGARFADAEWAQQYPITVVPYRLQLGDQVYRDGVDLTVEETFYLMAGQSAPPVIYPPTEADFIEAYNHAALTADAVLSIHSSRDITSSWEHGRSAVQKLSDSRPIALIDSRTLCAAQGLLVKFAAELAGNSSAQDVMQFDFNDYVRLVRGAVDRIYSLYFVEDVHYLTHHRYIPVSHGVIASIFHMRPFIALENGHISVIEKMRTKSNALDHLVDYIAEFDDILELTILQSKTVSNDTSRVLIDRLQELPLDLDMTSCQYSPVLAALIGTEATGCALIVKENGNLNYDED
jgi:DegV family protein with EDD domain